MAVREPTIRVTMLPRDTNARGTIFGGVILSHIDLAGAVAARQRAPRNFVTKAMHEVEFIAPVYVGDVVSFYASIVKIGRTSITVDVAVYAQRGLRQGNDEICIKVTEAVLTYVAVDENRRPRVVPQE